MTIRLKDDCVLYYDSQTYYPDMFTITKLKDISVYDIQSQLKVSKNISNEMFIWYMTNFKKQNPIAYAILVKFLPKFKKIGFNDTEMILTLSSVIVKIQMKRGRRLESTISTLLKHKPSFFKKLVKAKLLDKTDIVSTEKKQNDNSKLNNIHQLRKVLLTNKKLGSIKTIIKQNNNFIVVGSKMINGEASCWISKLDNKGHIIWENSKYDGSNCNFNNLKATKDGGYIAIGTSETSFFNMSKVVIYKYNQNGKIEWSKYYSSNIFTKDLVGNSKGYDKGYDVIPFSNKYLIIGSSQGKSSLWLFQIDNKGHKIKQTFINALDEVTSVIKTDKNHITIIGFKRKYGKDKDIYIKINITTMKPV